LNQENEYLHLGKANYEHIVRQKIRKIEIALEKDRDLRAIFLEEFMVFKFTIWERFTGFGTYIHPCL
jgi:hypothetical protein